MKTIKNLTRRPIRVPLPRNKTLHLGPGKSGQIATEAADFAALKKLVEAGEIEVTDEADAGGEGIGAGGKGGGAHEGHGAGGSMRRSGDR